MGWATEMRWLGKRPRTRLVGGFLVVNRLPINFKKTIPRRSLEIRISRVLLKECRYPQGGGGPGDLAYSRNREIRISSDRLGKDFFVFFRNVFKTRNLVLTAIVLQLQQTSGMGLIKLQWALL